MFGYIVADKNGLSEAQLLRYRAFYCGLCRKLREKYGHLARFTLNYDMTFLIMLLSSLYEPEEQSGTEKCAAHPRIKHGYVVNKYTEYAADMNIALTYYKCLDDWHDDKSVLKCGMAKLLKNGYRRVKGQYPRQCSQIEAGLEGLARLEKADSHNPDAASGLFGRIMGEIFAYENDYWADRLRAAGTELGQFIYMMDACIDLKTDIRYNKWNPLKGFSEKPLGEYRDMLTMLIGECTIEFEKLPLVQDLDILRNILYSGVWQRYNAELAKHGDVKHGK